MELETSDIEVMVEGEGLAEVEIIRLPQGSVARELVVAVASKVGFPPEEAVLLVEDSDEEVDLALCLTKEMVGERVHHVHRAHKIAVTVAYKEGQKEARFSPSSRIQRILGWAVSKEEFNIDPVIAPDMELALHDHTTALPKNAHIGRYVHHPHHRLSLDLIRGIVPNGSGH